MTATSAQPGAARPAGHSRSGRKQRLLRARPGDPVWARPALLGLLVGTGLLYLADLSRNGWANEFYAAAVQPAPRAGRRSCSARWTPRTSSPWTSPPGSCGPWSYPRAYSG